MKDTTTAQLLTKLRRSIDVDPETVNELAHEYIANMRRLAEIVERQQAQIAALEAARAPHGPPLEGTGPLPLERKGG